MSQRPDPFALLDPYARHLLTRIAARHGLAPGADAAALQRAFGAVPRHAGLLRALAAALAAPPPEDPRATDRDALRAATPDLGAHLALLDHCAAHLPDVLAGRVQASDVLFPDGRMDLVEPVYRGNRWSDHFNRLTATATRRAVAARQAQAPGETVRIIEVGAGTGGTSAAVLAALDGHGTGAGDGFVYHYTDISPGFVQHGRRVHGAGRDWFDARPLDLERPLDGQGFAGAAYDVVIATNVLHATRRIDATLAQVASLLRPGGLLLLNEITRAGAYAAMTFGLLDGWWASRDPEVRLPDAPVLSAVGWRAALGAAGFAPPATFGWTEPADTSFQCLFVAAKASAGLAANMRSTAPAVRHEPAQAPPPAPAPDVPPDLVPHLAACLAGVLGFDTSELADDRPFAEYGVDSIVAPQFTAAVNRALGTALVPSDVFNCATLAGMAAYLAPRLPAAPAPEPPPPPAATPPAPVPEARAHDIAVIGLACRLPGAPDAAAFWSNLLAGRSAITEVPPSRWDWRAQRPDGPPLCGGFLDAHDCFDPEFFNLSWREAEAMSPQQRVFLEQAWAALEDAGYGRRALAGMRCGVFVGAAPDGAGMTRTDSLSSLGGSLAILSARLSYLLDLKGPSLPVDTACSSSLVAVHLACRSLLDGECDMALAGGVSILMTDARLHAFLDDAGMLSPTGRCHTFDAAADGFVPGEGAGVVVLRRLDRALADGDHVLAVIRATGVNQDGRTSGITAPSGAAQTALEREVHERAGVSPDTIGLVEAHGTGTPLGDPIEVGALTAAFRAHTDRTGFCALGSVKTNIGHTLTAAGVAGLIKAILAVRHAAIPPSLNYAAANPEIDFAATPFYVPRTARPWEAGDTPRRAAVSSFGFSGTNAHAVIEAAPPPEPRAAAGHGPALILLSARTAEALAARRDDLCRWLDTTEPPDLHDLAWTLAQGRAQFEHRACLIVDSIAALRAALASLPLDAPPVTLPSRAADATLAGLLASPGPADAARLEAVAACWRRGADGDWRPLFGPDVRRVPLPAYRFARQPFPPRPPLPADDASGPHPLIAANISGFDGVAFRVRLDPALPWLRDHVLGGRRIVPAAACAEMLRAAAALALGTPVARLEGVRLDRPLPATDDAEARIDLHRDDEAVRASLRGAAGLHAEARAVAAAIPAPAPLDPDAIGARLPARFDAGAIYGRFDALGFAYGPSLRRLRGIQAGPDEVLATLDPPAADAALGFHPALVDTAIQAAVGLWLGGGEAALARVVPAGIGAITLHDATGEAAFVHVRRRPAATEATRRRLDIAVLDRAGRVLLSIEDLAVHVAAATAAARPEDAVLRYVPVWRAAGPHADAPVPAGLLLFDRDEALWRHLGRAPVLVRPGSAFSRLDARCFAVDPARADDLVRLLDTLRDEGFVPEAAWHAWSGGQDADDDATRLRLGVQAVALLAATLARRGLTRPVQLVHVHPPGAAHAAAGGLAAALARETPLLPLVTIETDALGAVASDLLARRLAAETAALRDAPSPPHARTLRWRADGMRETRALVPAPATAADGPGLREGGTYLLTGAFGGIGRHVALHLARRWHARLVLVGRRTDAASALIDAVRAAGGAAVAVAADITDPAGAERAAAAGRAAFGPLNGVIHAAGVTRDGYLLNQDADALRDVLAPKVAGTCALDRATADDPLDLFVCFSSLAGALGNAGQAGYSAANRFLDVWAGERRGPGRTLAIGWPYWWDGGTRIDPAEQARRAEATGIRSLATDEALGLFDGLAGRAEGSILLLPGDAARIRALIDGAAAHATRAAPATDAGGDRDAALAYLRARVAEATGMPEARILPDRPLEHYGLDSLLVTKLNARLEADLGALPKTLFYEHQTLRGVAAYLASAHGGHFAAPPATDAPPTSSPRAASAQGAPRAGDRDADQPQGIAIIGIAGRYPGADDLDAFWANLCADRDLIVEIPADRWALADWHDAAPAPGRSYSRWGGFLSSVDGFDPLFFNIAPGDAAAIDPNERLFLETCWEALEDSGHTRASLCRDPARRVGVYAGVMYGDYALLAADRHARGRPVGGAAPYWSVANRVSYHFDLHGPSLTVDSACSSSLTAIHLACQAIASGECTAAIAGGVNLSLHPLKYVGLSQGRFAASDGRCHSFTAGGDGYVPGEGVGAVILKPLAAALADGDHVHAVIRGWAANHGGKTAGYTVPSPVWQGDVIGAALRRGQVAPASVSYVEAHGTGTALGDPIEAAGLAAAYGDDGRAAPCALGSVKANIGHLEAAAGIAGLTRVVLQLRHRTLTPTRRHGPPNPNIDFDAIPFRLQTETVAWDGPVPLRAGVSSFGAGGANAHVIVEAAPPRAEPDAPPGPFLFVLSARTDAQLRAYAERMAAFLRAAATPFADICRTLQIGREPMAARLAFVCSDRREAADRLDAWRAGMPAAIHAGMADEATRPAVPDGTDPDTLAAAWAAGADIDFATRALPGRRTSVPARPFMRRRFWIDAPPARARNDATRHPYVAAFERTDGAAVATARFDRTMPEVRDHVVRGRHLVPGVAQIELARATASLAGRDAAALRDIVWPAPLAVAGDGTTVRATLRDDAITIATEDGRITFRARLAEATGPAPAPVAIAALRATATERLDGAAIYARLAALGLDYGPALRVLTELGIAGDTLVATLAPAHPDEGIVLPPATLDAALQALIGFLPAGGALSVPYAVDAVRCHGALREARHVVARRHAGADGATVFDLALCDPEGRVLLRLDRLAARPVATEPDTGDAAAVPVTIRRPVWRPAARAAAPGPAPSPAPAPARCLIVHGGDDLGLGAPGVPAWARPASAADYDALVPLAEAADDIVWVGTDATTRPERAARPEARAEARAEALAVALLRTLAALGRAGRLDRPLGLRVVTRGMQRVGARDVPDPVAAALSGLAKSAAQEYPRLAVTLSDLDDASLARADMLAEVLDEPAGLPVRETAWRGGVRHVLDMQPAELPQPAAPWLAPGAVVLIAGGAGGIGLRLAAWLARAWRLRVALTGRSAPEDVAPRLAGLDAGAGEIRYFRADITDADALRGVVAALRGIWGGIDAAIHAALVLRDRTIARMDEETLRAVLAPKLAGSVALAEALSGEPLQLYAVLSSASAIAGSRGQANYAAASSFADAHARFLAATTPWRVRSIDWGLWSEVGAVRDAAMQTRVARQGVLPLRPEEGIAAFAAAIAGPHDHLAILRAAPAALRTLGLDAVAQDAADTDRDAPLAVALSAAASLPEAAVLHDVDPAFTALERDGRRRLRAALLAMAGGEDITGKAWTTEGLRRRLRVDARHARLFAALLDALARDGLIDARDGLWRFMPPPAEAPATVAAPPWLDGPRRLLAACLDAYPALLRGEADPLAVLFPPTGAAASTDGAGGAYAGNPLADHYNEAAAAAVAALVARRRTEAPEATVRIIELGAGTGATTGIVLDALVAHAGHVTYRATDLSQRFLVHLRGRFGDRPGFEVGLCDAERMPEANGEAPGSYDVVLAANVLHATADIVATLRAARRLLRPGGVLLLSEATRRQDFGTFVFGLTPGWWRATDTARRLPHAPLLDADGWRAALAETGYAASAVHAAAALPGMPHALILAENRESHAAAAPARVTILDTPPPPPPHHAPRHAAGEEMTGRLHAHLRGVIAEVLRLEPAELRLHEGFDRYGLESLAALDIRNRLDADIPGLPATLLFEHDTLARLADWLIAHHGDAVAALLDGARPSAPDRPDDDHDHAATPAGAATGAAPAPVAADPAAPAAAAADLPIAIIGHAGHYPGGPDPDAFWRLLLAGDSAIATVPAGRWYGDAGFDPDGGEGRAYTRAAGFIDGVDRFDAEFFAIAPVEAEVMDPQERLFLQTAWTLLETAGYTPAGLRATAARDGAAGDVGVFVGVMNGAYQWVAAEAWAAGHANAAASGHWSIANRVSWTLDLHGPSLLVDTACSASLTAIHLACESLRRGECGAAIAGGVNLILHPRQLVQLSQARMLSRGGECRAFGAGADGFVDGEGVGAVLLKPLAAAERDGDRIEAVILGSAVNAGGRTSGYTVPSPRAQAGVIRAALRRAGVAPETVTYVEAHGTGTALGDPIEIAGLAEAYAGAARSTPCAIGAVKANIGHLESAAGVAGLAKVLLQMRARTIAPLRHAATPNPLIDFARTPFVLPAAPTPWEPAAPGGRLRAGISSFGAGGANAHVVVESYPPPAPVARPEGAELIVLSAHDDAALRRVARRLLDAIGDDAPPLADVAYTLRVGRAALPARCAFVATGREALHERLAAVAADGAGTPPAASSRMLAETAEGRALIAALLARRDLDAIGRLWAEGADIDWTQLPPASGPAPRRVALPTYPFAATRHWLDAAPPAAGSVVATVATPADPAPEQRASEPTPVAPDPAPEPMALPADQPGRMQLFVRTWRAAAATPGRSPLPVAVVARDPALARALAPLWPAAVFDIRPGPAFTAGGDGGAVFDPASDTDHASLLAHLRARAPDGFAVIQALDWDAPRDDAAVMATVLLTQAAQRAGGGARLLHLYADADARPLDAAVGALARSAAQENDATRLRALGLAGPVTVARAAQRCRDELLAADDAPEVIWRDDARHVPDIAAAAPGDAAGMVSFRIGGAYLLVGGLGEVGCAIAERLARDYRARIAIIGRSAPRGPALERLERLRAAGVAVQYEACSLDDAPALAAALASIRAQTGRIHGVLHLAREVEDALLVRKTAAGVARVMAAKVAGSRTLDAALADEPLDWFVLCSSLAAWLGLAGGGDYALACAFQNGFARLREAQAARGERSGRTVAICWPQWRYDRFLNDAKLHRLAAMGLGAIDAREGLRIIEQALASGHGEVAALKGSDAAMRGMAQAYRDDTAARAAPDTLPAEIAALSDADLLAYLDHLEAAAPASAAPAPAPSAPPPVPARPVPSREAIVTDIVCGFLKLPPGRVAAATGFAELGLDSIKALHIAERLQKRLGTPVDPAMFFEHPTIAALARALDGATASRPVEAG